MAGKSAQEQSPRLESLTGLRFVAAFLVFLHHADQVLGSARLSPFRGSARSLDLGASGVTFFFVLSGFVLCWSRRPDDDAKAFYRRRLARIYPAYLAVWVVVVAASVISGSESVQPAPAALTVSMLQAWVPSPSVYFGVSAPLWSVSVEVFFYGLFPFLLPMLVGLSDRARRQSMLAIVTTMAVVAHVSTGISPLTTPAWLVNIFPPVRLPEFVLGILLALEIRAETNIRVGWAACGWATILGVLVAVAAVGASAGVMIAPFALIIIVAAQSDLDGRGSIFARSPLVMMGRWSYGFYLVHASVLLGVVLAMKYIGLDGQWLGAAGGLVIAMFALAVSLGISAALYICVEQPGERYFRRRAPAA